MVSRGTSATMTFFEQQHVARRNTHVMVVLFEITNMPDDAHYRLLLPP
jgi:hypothetical protein